MQKRGFILGFFLFLFGINFVSAAFHYGGYSLSDLLNTFDSSTVILTSIFIIAFVLIFWPLSKFFKENALIAGIISFAISFLIIFEINRRGYDFAGFFYGIGISEGIFSFIIPLVLIVGLIFSGFKYGWGITLTSIGGFLIITSFTDIIYAKGATFIIGAILLGIGIWLWRRGKKGGFAGGSNQGYGYQDYDAPYDPSQRQIYKQQRTQQKYQQNLENHRRIGELTQQKHQQKLAERERQSHAAEVRRRAEKIAKIRTRREKAEIQKMKRRETELKMQQESQQRSAQERELRRQQSKQNKIKDRYIRRFGEESWKNRGGK